MNTKQTIYLYSVLGTIGLIITYVIFSAAKVSSWEVETTKQTVLILVASCVLLLSILFFLPVATGLVPLSEEKNKNK
jgi:multisubunit Na+/H+ antiporter MnhB subunit